MSDTVHLVYGSTVEYVGHDGDDLRVVRAARVSTGADSSTGLDEGARKLIGFLMREKHASPFEHVSLTVLVDTPIFVAREFMRHRTLSYNETSGRYRVLEPRFYVPPMHRPLVQIGKAGAYTLEPGDSGQYGQVLNAVQAATAESWRQYQVMLDGGIAKEVARLVLPVTIMTQFYVTGRLRNWLNFLTLRTAPNAQWEIRQVAAQIEAAVASIVPATHAAWVENGRGQI